MEITIDQAIDVGYATLWRMRKDALEMTFNTGHYELFNMWFGEKAERGAGDMIKDYITLKDTGNGKHISLWEEDSNNVVNTDAEIRVDWKHYTTNLSYNRIELGMNMGDEVRVYNYLKGKMDNMFRELAEDIQLACVLSPTSASDKKNPEGLASWLSLGTDDSTGAWTGYRGVYNDGAGTKYDVGGINSTATSNARWASYFADHGNVFDQTSAGILSTLFRATTATKFIVPIIPKKGKIDENQGFGNFRYYTNLAVLAEFETLLRNADDRIGSDLGKYAGVIVYKGIPMIYLEELDDANATLRGANPIYGVNHDYFKVTVLRDNDFVVGKPTPRDNAHNVLRVPVDLSYAIHSCNRQRSGFLLSYIA